FRSFNPYVKNPTELRWPDGPCASGPSTIERNEMRKPILAFLLLTVCLTAVALGQGTASRVTGSVVDEKGSVVPGAVVTLTNEATQSTLTTETSSGGTYVFD